MGATRVLHVLPTDHARGAQVYARALCDELGGVAAGHRVVTLFAGPRLAARADDELAVPADGLRRVGFDPRAAMRLHALVARTAPEVVVAHGAEAVKYLSSLRVRRGGPKLALYAIGIALPKAHQPAVRAAYTALFRIPDAVACVSAEVVTDSAEVFRVPIDRLFLVPNGRALPTAARTPHHPTGAPTIAFVGHLTASKRPERFLEVISALRERGYAGRAWMAGDGPLLEAMRQQGPGAGVEVLGRREDVPALLADSDIMCFTSVPDGEGMPGVLIEAGMAGMPIVATAVPGASAVILDDQTGRVVPVDDRQAMVDAVQVLIDDRDLLERMGAAARVHCEMEFSLTASADRWRQLFAGITSTPVGSW